MKPYSPVVQTLYQELVQQAHMRVEQRGSVYVRTIKGIEYVYVKEQAGSVRRDKFLGRKDNPDIKVRIGEIELANERASGRRKLVQALKSSGVPAPNSALCNVLDVLENAGPFA